MGHLNKVKEYIKGQHLIRTRKKEEYDILNDYARPSRRGLENHIHYNDKDFEEIKPQALFLFTDDVINIV
ncbi:hypothetical protein SAMN06296386_109114 [Lachnospiraceae bacterium]|nr:hypothetical protein SAMN06296386_109114 [Lachnospiraceae bacterium]